MKFLLSRSSMAVGLAVPSCLFLASGNGITRLSTFVFLVGAFVIFLAIARVIAQGGVGFTSSTMLPQPFLVYTLHGDGGMEGIGFC